jgi:cell division protein FtsW
MERRDVRATFRGVFLPGFAYVAVTAALVLVEPDLGQSLFLVALSLVMLLINGLRLSHVLAVAAVVLPSLVILMKSQFAYIQSRIETFSSGGADYQVTQGLKALAAGGMFGTGIGDGRAHLRFVPKIHNDFIMVAIGEQLGFLGCLLVLALFLCLFYHGLRIAFRARDALGFSVAFGVTLMIALQAAVNLAVVTNSVPPKGMSLPFVSYGGSSLLVLGASLGLLVSVARGADAPSTEYRTHPMSGSCKKSIPPNSRKKLDTSSTPPRGSASGAFHFLSRHDQPPA